MALSPLFSKRAPQKKGNALDFQDYEDHIANFWRSSATKQTPIFSDLLTRVSRLEEAVLYSKEEQRSLAASLLGHYLLLAGNAYRYRGHIARAIEYLDKAFVLAHERNDEELLAKVHYVRGFTFFNRWTNQDTDDRTTLIAALQDFNAAEQMVCEAQRAGTNRAFSPSLITAILADGGRAAAYNATTQKDCLAAAHKVERAGKIVCASHFSPDTHFLRIDKGWWHIDKAEAFLAGGWPDLAIEHLESMEKGDLQARQRYLYREIIQAEAYIAKGWGDIGIMYLERTLDALDQTTVRRHLTHIKRIHRNLTQDEQYRKMPAVAHLGGMLFLIQHPELLVKE